MERNSLFSKKREREIEEASSSLARNSKKFLKSLTIPDNSFLKLSDQPHKLDLSKREIGESSTKDHMRMEASKESDFGGEIHKVLIQYNKAMQGFDEIMQNKLCNILSEDKDFHSQLKEIHQALDVSHTACMDTGNSKQPLTEPYEKLKDALRKYGKITDELRTNLNAELKKLIPTNSWEVSSIDSLKSLETHICQNIREILSNEEIDVPYRCRIINGIGASDNQDVVPALVKILPDEQINQNIRSKITEAIRALGARDVILASDDKKLVSDLVKMLPNNDINFGLRYNVAETIGALRNQDVVSDLVKMLPNNDINSWVRCGIVRAIGALYNTVVPKSLDTSEPRISPGPHGANLSGECCKDVLPDLVKMLPNKHIDWEVRQEIAKAIGFSGAKDVLPGLIKMLPNKHIDWEIRCEITKAIRTLGDKDVIPDLENILQHQKIGKRVYNEIYKTVKDLRTKKPAESTGD